MNWIATQKRCDSCGNSRIIVSENGFHSVCCLSEKKCMDCFMGKKDHYLGRNTNIKDRLAGEWEFTEKISYDVCEDCYNDFIFFDEGNKAEGEDKE